MIWVFANRLGDRGSIPTRVKPKTQKMVLDATLLNTQHYKVRIKGKVEQSCDGVESSLTLWCSSYWKGSRCPMYDTKQYLIVRFHFWRMWSNISLASIPGMVSSGILVYVSSTGQVDRLKNDLYSTGPCGKKKNKIKYKFQRNNKIYKYERTKDAIPKRLGIK